jgi:hypothetical protein
LVKEQVEHNVDQDQSGLDGHKAGRLSLSAEPSKGNGRDGLKRHNEAHAQDQFRPTSVPQNLGQRFVEQAQYQQEKNRSSQNGQQRGAVHGLRIGVCSLAEAKIGRLHPVG